MNIKKITPVLYEHELEPCVKFWTEHFGFQKTVEVPDGNSLGFVILLKDSLELMYQSFASGRKDVPRSRTRSREGAHSCTWKLRNSNRS